MAEYTISKIKLPNGDVCNIKDTIYSAGTGIGISGTTISNTGITGIKGNSESSYRTGQVNLTPENLGAVAKNAELLTTNPFAPSILRGPYISKIDNAFYAADKRWNITATKDSNALPRLFDGSYETFLGIAKGTSTTITMDFSNEGYFPGYPYGYILISFYYQYIPANITGRVYCDYEPHGIGWHDLTFSQVNGSSNSNMVYTARQGVNNITTIEITITASSSIITAITQIEMHLDRPDSSRTPFLSKYGAETLYYNLTAPSFIGSGASLTNLNASNLSSGTVAIGHGGTGATTALDAITNLGGIYGLVGGTNIAANKNIDTDYKSMGTYISSENSRTKTLTGVKPVSGSGFKLITTVGYLGSQIHQFATAWGKDLYYRSSTDTGSTWSDWYKFVLLKSNGSQAVTDNSGTVAKFVAIGNTTTPVYVNSNGVITAGTALKSLAYKDSLAASDIPNLSTSKLTSGTLPVDRGGTGVTSLDDLRTNLGLSNAMHFRGIATVAITDGSTTDPTISGYTFGTNGASAVAGDVVIDKDSSFEYVWSGSKWERLGGDSSYKIIQTAKSDPTASTTTSTTFIDTISQDANGVITATKKTLPSYVPTSTGVTAVTWDSTNNKLTRTINGTAADVVTIGTIKTALALTKSDVGLGNVANSTYAGGTAVTLNNSSKASSTASFYAPTTGGTADTQALVGNGTTAAPKWVDISPSITIGAGTGSAAPTVNVTVLGQSGIAKPITIASTSVYGVTKLNDGIGSNSTTLAATANSALVAAKKVASSNSISKLYLVGATSQSTTGVDSYSYQYTYVKEGLLSSTQLGLNASGTEKAHIEWNATDQSIDFVFN